MGERSAIPLARSSVQVVALWVALALGALTACNSGAASGGVRQISSSTAATTTTTLPSTEGRLDTALALRSYLDLMGPDMFGSELTVTLRRCPIADANALFSAIADRIQDDAVVRVLRTGFIDTLLLSLPNPSVTVATCMVGAPVANSPIESVRIEVRPGSETIASLLGTTTKRGTATVQEGDAHRGGTLYQYCATRPDNVRRVCAAGWRNDDLDIALTFNGAEVDLIDLDDAQTVLVDLLDEIVAGIEDNGT